MPQPFNIIPPTPWVKPDGSPTTAFFRFISSLFNATGSSGSSTGTIQSNISGSVATPTPNTLTAILDAVIDNTRGDIIVRGASVWQKLTLGSMNKALVSNGTDLVYETIVNALAGGGGVTVSAATGGVTLGLGSALTLASGTPASITTAGGDLLLESATGNVQLGSGSGTVTIGTSGGTTKLGQTAAAALIPGNFSATRIVTLKDGAGNTVYVPGDTATW